MRSPVGRRALAVAVVAAAALAAHALLTAWLVSAASGWAYGSLAALALAGLIGLHIAGLRRLQLRRAALAVAGDGQRRGTAEHVGEHSGPAGEDNPDHGHDGQPGHDYDRHDHEYDGGHDHGGHDHGGHDHDHGGHDHPGGWRGFLAAIVRPHSHDAADKVDSALATSKAGMRALKISLAGLAVTAAAQLGVVLVSGSVALLADTIHNVADALTALPIGIAFLVGRRAANRRYTYGYGRSEDVAGLFVLLAMAASAALACYEAISRLVHPQQVHDLGWVAAAGVIGFAGNELVALYRIRAGRRIGSAALVADGLHARTDGLTSLAVVVGAAGVAAGWPAADPVVGLVISVAILGVLRQAAREIYGRIMDRVDEAIVTAAEDVVREIDGVRTLDRLRMRWIGHELLAEVEISADPALSLAQSHDIAENVRHELLHQVRRLGDATVHVSPVPDGHADPHHETAHHFGPSPGSPGGPDSPGTDGQARP